MRIERGFFGITRAFRYVVGVFVLAALAGLPALAETGNDSVSVDWPDTYAGHWAEAFFEAYNTDGTEALLRFVNEHYSQAYLEETPAEEEIQGGPLTIRNMVGKVAVHSVTAEGEFVIDAVAETENAGWVHYRVELSAEPPHDLAAMGPYAAAEPPGETGGQEGAPSPAAERGYSDWTDLHELLRQVCDDAGIPGLAAAVVDAGGIRKEAVVGVRRMGSTNSIQSGDLFQLGSVTKVLSGAMLTKLVQRGGLRWDMGIGEVLSDVPMREEYEDVTLDQLLRFRGGLPNYPSGGEFAEVMSFEFRSDKSPAEGRKAHVRQVLLEEPVGDPDEEEYSSAAYVVAAHMAERVTGKSWERLMQEVIFEPLGMQSAGFGWPATEERPDQPRGHYGTPPDIVVQEIGVDPFGVHTYTGPAGDVTCSIGDLARFAAFQLRVLNGMDSTLDAEAVAQYWNAADTEEPLYGFYGSGGTFLAMIMVYPERDLGIVAAANHGLHAMPYLTKLRDAVYERMTR